MAIFVLGALAFSSVAGYVWKRLYNQYTQKGQITFINGSESGQIDENQGMVQRTKIMELADKIFSQASETLVTYGHDRLVEGGTIIGDNPVPFRRFRDDYSYMRRCPEINQLFKYVPNYQKMISEHLVQNEYGLKRITPTALFQKKLEEKDPAAFRISAMLFQLGDDLDMLPPMPEIDISYLEGRAIALPHEVGQIIFKNDGFEIQDDQITIKEVQTGEVIGAYKVHRTVTVESSDNYSVKCKITRVFEKINLHQNEE